MTGFFSHPAPYAPIFLVIPPNNNSAQGRSAKGLPTMNLSAHLDHGWVTKGWTNLFPSSLAGLQRWMWRRMMAGQVLGPWHSFPRLICWSKKACLPVTGVYFTIPFRGWCAAIDFALPTLCSWPKELHMVILLRWLTIACSGTLQVPEATAGWRARVELGQQLHCLAWQPAICALPRQGCWLLHLPNRNRHQGALSLSSQKRNHKYN